MPEEIKLILREGLDALADQFDSYMEEFDDYSEEDIEEHHKRLRLANEWLDNN